MAGILFVISGPSGVGKSTVRKEVMKRCSGLRYSISCTTRPPREGEINGVDYLFVDLSTFEAMKRQGEFLEWARVHGNYYGTPRKPIEEWLKKGEDVILEIDVQGAKQVKKNFKGGVFIFIAPPSLKALEERLKKRNTDREDEILLRMTNARIEMQCISDYDYLVVNDQLEEAVNKLLSIIIAERCRIRKPHFWGGEK
ncbi:MAG: guanylate kinase [Candidatus Atribacteria bacterium]|uniref:Guanylate kinase n=2 Tax=Atribacterales TaxID=2847775 RepID=A0ABZ2YBP9_9BACT|nr:guanylate kinase [Candidatus Atribacteria bacterium]